MRPIYLAQLDKARPVVILTREPALDYLTSITVAPISTRVRGIHSEVPVGTSNGLDQAGVINCDNITTIRRADLLRAVGFLSGAQETALGIAISHAFDLDPTP